MSQSSQNLAAAEALLARFNCLDVAPSLDAETRSRLQEALSIVAGQSQTQLFGACADNFAAGLEALQAYTVALGCPISRDPDRQGDLSSGVYLKYNPARDIFYAEPYQGEHRGVLVSCQSETETGVNGTYGHLPLDLFDPSDR